VSRPSNVAVVRPPSAGGRRTAADAIAQISLARIGSLAQARGGRLSPDALPYLEQLRQEAYKWIASIDAEMVRLELVARFVAARDNAEGIDDTTGEAI
jgi:hypothetical protein